MYSYHHHHLSLLLRREARVEIEKENRFFKIKSQKKSQKRRFSVFLHFNKKKKNQKKKDFQDLV